MNLSLLDHFAGQALQGLLSGNPQIPVNHLVMTSYHIAQKMIEQKNQLESKNLVTTSKEIKLDNVENL
jgi:hypothetical protein